MSENVNLRFETNFDEIELFSLIELTELVNIYTFQGENENSKIRT